MPCGTMRISMLPCIWVKHSFKEYTTIKPVRICMQQSQKKQHSIATQFLTVVLSMCAIGYICSVSDIRSMKLKACTVQM